MSIKKAYCKECSSSNEDHRIFEVDEDAPFCYCPNCMKKYAPVEAINNFVFYIKGELTVAENLLFVANDYNQALEAFAHIIDIDPDNVRARYGRLLCYICLSTLRSNYFDQIVLLINEESDLYFRKSDSLEYIKFIKKANDLVNKYYSLEKKRLKVKNYFFDESCMRLYGKNILRIKLIKETLLRELEFLKGKDDYIEVGDKPAVMKAEIYKIEQELSKTFNIADGSCYNISRVTKFNEPVFERELHTRKGIVCRRCSVDENVKNAKSIKDTMYSRSNVFYLIKSRFTTLSIILALIGVAVGISYAVQKEKLATVWLAGISFALLVSALILFILHRIAYKKVFTKHIK